ncbi:DUF429 domain-containing protein [Salisediminibacterium beveridgei]|uniref:DUF429 domain-containing protein n=1 Tax=Salisediminibacterium beveridgei TaxID=632773 RepID=A0A1D7QT40_9BACI|nr:DUF429 domain-containing protein [Salisediminibacterium beveridgei]AOM82170.1 hypothetical protein BBEV_0799 [Salisediminibacterium beveridgei]
MTKFMGLGWDVGGWMGKNHGLAVCVWDGESDCVVWPSQPFATAMPKDRLWRVSDLVEMMKSGDSFHEDIRITVGVDAPLGYPELFTQLLNGSKVKQTRPDREIDNRMAYRQTDRYIYKTRSKKPLSASFDRIGNNATVAMLHANQWREEEGFTLEPQDNSNGSSRTIIEVYPALVKMARYKKVQPFLEKQMPAGLDSGTDAYDAAICALYAMAYQTKGKLLPELVHPKVAELDQARHEGWIFPFEQIESE